MSKVNLNWNWLYLLFFGRVLTAASFFMYVGSISFLMNEWNLSSTSAGIIQTAHFFGLAGALYLSSYYSDFINPSKILIYSSVLNVIGSFLFFLYANNFFSALFLNFILGIAAGGIYGPSMILVSEKFSKSRKGFAMGMMLGGQSLGYVVSLSLSFIFSNFYNFKDGFLICSILTFFGLASFYFCCHKDLYKKLDFKIVKKFKILKQSYQNRTLIKGYTAHCIELFGMWAWMPVFLSIVLIDKASINPVILGLLISITIHITGVFANIISGMFSDRFGSRNVLIIFAISSSALSFTIGWVTEWYWITILIISFFYSFFTLGDSGVLTAALTDVTKRNVLGRSLAFRSIIGIGFGSITPSIFGFIMDVSNSYLPLSKNTNWIYAFSFLGISGLIASYYATKLNRRVLSRSF
ncbi:MFS transporter [Candidatus Pelagibacter sp. HIMB109]|uniref:MFS transporter n=1 Tax=Candidatus Pelagibacter sp. HIMB109 TaxID=3415412 RepID=UPI003F85992E